MPWKSKGGNTVPKGLPKAPKMGVTGNGKRGK